ncbi:hypothetical protein JCM5350_002277 [Sporobolomyces pararoseus]
MTPVASTSQASSASLPSSVPDSTPKRSQLSRKGKEKAIYTPPSYDFDDPLLGLYQPRSGQLQRRKITRSKGAKSKLSGITRGRKSDTEGSLGVETIRIGAALEKNHDEGNQQHSEEPLRKKRKKREISSASKPKKRAPPPSTDDIEAPSSQPDILDDFPASILTQSSKRKKDKQALSPSKKKKKKSVRLDLPVPIPSTSSSSDNDFSAGDNDVFRPETEDEEPYGSTGLAPALNRRTRNSGPVSSDANEVNAAEEEERRAIEEQLLDYSNPINLPRTNLGNQQRRTSRKYWRGLEFGVYRSALYDAVNGEGGVGGENDLGKLVWNWEKLVRERRKDEMITNEEGEQGDDETDKQDKGEKDKKKRGRPRLPRGPKWERERSGSITPRTPRTPRRRTRSTTAEFSSTAIGDEGDETGAEGRDGTSAIANTREEEEEDEEEPRLALPSSRVLDRMARWPIHSSELVNYSIQAGQRNDFQEELEVLAEQTRRDTIRSAQLDNPPHQRRHRRSKIPSAYSVSTANSPRVGNAEANSDSEGFDSDSSYSSSSLDLPSPPPFYPPSFLQIPQTINAVLQRLSDFVPKEPLPALDIWSVREREEGIKLDRKMKEKEAKKSGKKLGDSGPGWKEVIAVARENESIPKHVVDKLEQQLKEMYEEASNGEEGQSEPVILPPVGGTPVFPHIEPKPKKVKLRKKKTVETEPEAAAAGSTGNGDEGSTVAEGPVTRTDEAGSAQNSSTSQQPASASTNVEEHVSMQIDS